MDLDLSIKVTYFNIAGAAEKVRLALVMCGKEFQDERINFQVFVIQSYKRISIDGIFQFYSVLQGFIN